MATLNILEFPDKRLRTVAKPVTEFDDALRQTVSDMLETMYDAPGIGLAATQVDIHKQLIVIDVSEDKSDPKVIINPEIIDQENIGIMQEGCLSVPDIYADVERAQKVKIRAQDQFGESYEMEAEELFAVCIQHEMDHLQGKLFVDYLSPLKRERVKKKLQKRKKLMA